MGDLRFVYVGWVVSIGMCSIMWIGLCQLVCAVLMWIGLGCVSWDVQCNVDWFGLCQLGCAM